MSEKLGITRKYSREILDIENKLRELENGRIYELTRAGGDGYLATNVKTLRKMLNELIVKIDNQSPSTNDELAEALGRVKEV